MKRALVLAAGRGERLRPLTDISPKPLLPVLGASILERTLRQLAAAGVDASAVNLHHLGAQIPRRLGDEVEGMPLTFSPEEELLGTLGPLRRLRSFFDGADPVLLVNGDSLCQWPIDELLAAHQEFEPAATLLLSARADIESFGGGVSVDRDGSVLAFRGDAPTGTSRQGVFAGLHVISPAILEGLEERPSDIVRDLYEPLVARGEVIRTVFTDRPWHDLGTPRRYLDGVLDLAASSGSGWCHEHAVVARRSHVEGSVLECGAEVSRDASVQGSLLLDGSRVGSGSRVRDSIIGPEVEVPEGAEVEGLLVTRPAVETPL